MPRNFFTNNEITVCAYVALFGESEPFTVRRIATLTGRSEDSIVLKIRNFVSKLNSEGITTLYRNSGLTGTTTNARPRKTNWEIVQPLAMLTQEELRRRCADIIATHNI